MTPRPTPSMDERHAGIYRVIRAIPTGRVMTYGAVAAAAGLPGRARLVGMLLRRLPDRSRLPWQRVVNAAGRISARGGGGPIEQRLRLELEGVRFLPGGRIDLAAYGWHAPG